MTRTAESIDQADREKFNVAFVTDRIVYPIAFGLGAHSERFGEMVRKPQANLVIGVAFARVGILRFD